MTTTRKARRMCGDCHVQLTRENCDPSNNCPDVCNYCFDVGGYKTEHQDGHHEEEPLTGICPMCSPAIP